MYGGEATRAVNGSSWSFTESREGLEKALRKFAKQFVCWLWYLWTRVPISCIRTFVPTKFRGVPSHLYTSPHRAGGMCPRVGTGPSTCARVPAVATRCLLSRRSAGTPLTPDRSPHCEEYVIWNSWSPQWLCEEDEARHDAVTVRPACITARPLISEPTIVCIRRRGLARVLACAELINIHYSYCDRNSR